MIGKKSKNNYYGGVNETERQRGRTIVTTCFESSSNEQFRK